MININIVGSINDEEQLSDIETIAKVFMVERRINDLAYNERIKNISSNPQVIPKTKKDNHKNSYNKGLSLLTVHGLNWFLVNLFNWLFFKFYRV